MLSLVTQVKVFSCFNRLRAFSVACTIKNETGKAVAASIRGVLIPFRTAEASGAAT